MKAAVVLKYGPPEGVQIQEVTTPTPKSNEMLIKIHATTVTFGDAMLRRMGRASRLVMGLFMGGLGKGKILGHEFAGEIESMGDEVTRFAQGDHVFGSAGMKGGAHAEYICLPEDSMVAIKPTQMTFEEAAAVPVGAHTAYDILRKVDLQKGQTVLINGASGSVGSYAVQLAKYWGAEVTGVSSNVDLMKELGADHAINYKKEDFTKTGETFDVIFDTVRKLSSSDVRESLNKNGIFISTSTSTKETPENLELLRGLIEEGKLKALIDRTYQMDNIVEAHRHVDTGRKKGNVVITIIE